MKVMVATDGSEAATRAAQAAEPRRCLELLHLECRGEARRQVADVLRYEKIMLHEALDPEQAATITIAEQIGERALPLERQALFRPPGHEMQMATHAP